MSKTHKVKGPVAQKEFNLLLLLTGYIYQLHYAKILIIFLWLPQEKKICILSILYEFTLLYITVYNSYKCYFNKH